MSKSEVLEKQRSVFGKLFVMANKLQIMGDQVVSDDDMTIRQWLLTVAIGQFGDTPPTLRELSELMGSSHQNVKQLAVKLQQKGFIHIENDKKDQRAICLSLTEKSYSFWERKQKDIRQFLVELFKNLNDDEIDSLYDCLNKLYASMVRNLQQEL